MKIIEIAKNPFQPLTYNVCIVAATTSTEHHNFPVVVFISLCGCSTMASFVLLVPPVPPPVLLLYLMVTKENSFVLTIFFSNSNVFLQKITKKQFCLFLKFLRSLWNSLHQFGRGTTNKSPMRNFR